MSATWAQFFAALNYLISSGLISMTGVSNKATNTAQYSFTPLRAPLGMVGQSPNGYRAIKNNPGVTLKLIPGKLPTDRKAQAGKTSSIFSLLSGGQTILGTQQSQAQAGNGRGRART